MELKLTFDQIRPEGSDCTAPYKVIPNRQCTLQELIDHVLANRPHEWGYVGIGGWPCSRRAEYRWGKLLNSDLTNAELKSPIKTIEAQGGWSRMDYFVEI